MSSYINFFLIKTSNPTHFSSTRVHSIRSIHWPWSKSTNLDRKEIYSSTMKKTSLRVTVCLVLFVLILSFLSSVISERTFRLGQAEFLRQIRRPPCAFSRCTNGNVRKRAIAAIKRVLTKVRNKETCTFFNFFFFLCICNIGIIIFHERLPFSTLVRWKIQHYPPKRR